MKTLIDSLSYGWRMLCSRKVYLALLIVVPLAFTFFFIDMMDEGVAEKVPCGAARSTVSS